jgi:hypothetical protein
MDKITRREKLLAKVCWPEIDTQRTKFVLATGSATSYAFPVYSPQLEYRTDSAPVDLALGLGIEHISLNKWVYHGNRKHAVAKWGYSPKLDIVVIRDVRTAHNWAIDCETCWPIGGNAWKALSAALEALDDDSTS